MIEDDEAPASPGYLPDALDDSVGAGAHPGAVDADEPVRPRRGARGHRHAQRRSHLEETRARRDAARGGMRSVAVPRQPRTRPRKNVAARLAVAFAVLLAVVGAIAFGVWTTLYRAEASVPAGRHVTITVPKGASGDQVASLLAKAGVVTSATMFRIRTAELNAASDLKPGTYDMTTGSSYDRAIHMLQAGPQIVYVTFTIPEGWGIAAIAARVEQKFGIPAATFTELATTGAKRFDYPFLADDPTPSLEGYLFPKTYTLVKKSATATSVIDVMLAQYAKETAPLDYSYARSKGLSPHQALTVASIIEREAALDKDRPKVSSVIYNRLAIGMRLQLDSTVQYALNGKAKLTLSDLKDPSPYNTYMHAGVPPGPICCPGLVSIDAALHPAKTSYLYYILTGKDGSQSFTTNYAQFLQLKNLTQTKGLQ